MSQLDIIDLEIMEKDLLITNDNGDVIGTMPVKDAHAYGGVPHLATTLFIVRPSIDGREILLARRDPAKPLWGGYWETSSSTHQRVSEFLMHMRIITGDSSVKPYFIGGERESGLTELVNFSHMGVGGNINSDLYFSNIDIAQQKAIALSSIEAVRRGVRKELDAKLGDVEFLTTVRYKASQIIKDKNNPLYPLGSENQFCGLALATLISEPRPVKGEVVEIKWVAEEKLREKLATEPEIYAPWTFHSAEKYFEILPRLNWRGLDEGRLNLREYRRN